MRVPSFLRSLRQRWFGSRHRDASRRTRPTLESLEDRNLLATLFVDATNANPGVGTQADPFRTLQAAVQAANANATPDTVIVYGNGTVGTSTPYVWRNVTGALDGNILVEAEDTLIFRSKVLNRTGANPDDGATAPIVLKLQNNFIDVAGTLRVEGGSTAAVVFTSFNDPTAGGAPPVNSPPPNRRDWGGIRYRGTAVDQGADETTGSLVNYADLRYTGATLLDPLLPAGFTTEFSSIRMEYTGPNRTLATTHFDEANVAKVRVQNTVFRFGGIALDVDYWALGGTNDNATDGTATTGPDIRNVVFDNTALPSSPTVRGNTINGLFVNIPFVPSIPDFKGIQSRWDDVGVPYVLTQRLNVATDETTGIASVLTIDAGMVIKTAGNEIWASGDDVVHGGTLIVRGTAAKPVFFTGVRNDAVVDDPRIASLYANGSRDTNADGNDSTPFAGEWGGLTVSDGSIDHAVITYGGGAVPRPQDRFQFGGPLRFGGPFSVAGGLNGPFFRAGGPLFNAAPLTLANGLDNVFLNDYGTLRVANTEITLTDGNSAGATGTVRGALMAVGSGQTEVIDSFIHDNPVAAIFTWGQGTGNTRLINRFDNPSVYNTNPDPLGGYGIHFRRNVLTGNTNNGVVTDRIVSTVAYLDDTDIVQTINTDINATATNQVIQLQSQRAVLPIINLDVFQGDSGTTALSDFLARLPGEIGAGTDNTFFRRLIDFASTARGATLVGVGSAASGNLTGDEWEDFGVLFSTPGGNAFMPLKAFASVQADSSFASTAAQAIPDNPATPLESTITVPTSFPVSDVNVQVSITHPRVGDLRLELVKGATVVRLVSQAGGEGDNYTNTAFDDEATATINGAAAPFTGTFRPERPLTSFDGLDAQGDWTLRVTDLLTGQSGTLNSWSLQFRSPGLAGTGDPDPMTPVSGSTALTTVPGGPSQLQLTFPNQVSAVGFWVVDNDVATAGERIQFIDANGVVIDEIALPATTNGPVFVGRISRTPIHRVLIIEDPNDQINGAPDLVAIDDLFYVDAGQSLVVKAASAATNITSGGYDGVAVDSSGQFAVGGTIRVLGQAANPVVLTGLADDTAGAGIVGSVQSDTNGNGASTSAPGSWAGIRVRAGANSSRIENVVQQPNGQIIRMPADLNPYTIGDGVLDGVNDEDEPGSYRDTLDIDANYPAALLATIRDDDPATPGVQQNIHDGTLIEFANIRFAATGIDNAAYPDGKLTLEGTETDGGNGSPSNDTTANANQLPNMSGVFQTFNGAARVGGRLLGGANEDFWALPINHNLGGAINLNIRVDRTGVDDTGTSSVNIFVFNRNNQLIFLNSTNPFLAGFARGGVLGTSGYLGGITMHDGDVGFNLQNDQRRDASYILVTTGNRIPDVLVPDQNDPIPDLEPMALDPITGRATGYIVHFRNNANPPAAVDIPSNSALRGGTSGFSLTGFNEYGGYEMEVRTNTPGRNADAVRTTEGEIIFRSNVIERSATAAINLHDNIVAPPPGGFAENIPTQTARYFYPNADFNSNTGQTFTNPTNQIPGVQVYNNVIRLGDADGLVISDSTNGAGRLASTSPLVPSGYHLIFNNTIDGNAGDGIQVTSRGGPYILNNLVTNNGDVGITVADTGDVRTQGNLGFEPSVAPSQTVVDFNMLFENAGGHLQGQFQTQGSNITGVDPLYVDADAGDYRILQNSLAVDSGLSDLTDRLSTARQPSEAARAPNDDWDGSDRRDDPARPNVGQGTLPFFDRGAFEAVIPLAAADDSYSTSKSQVLSVPPPGVLQNDSGESLFISTANTTSALGAAVAVSSDGSFTYNPLGSPALQALLPGEALVDTFTYQVRNLDGEIATAVVRVTVFGDAIPPPNPGPGPGGPGGGAGVPAPVGPDAPLSFIITRRRRRGNRLILDIRVFNVLPGQTAPFLVLMAVNRKDRIVGGGISRNILPGRSFAQFGLDSVAANSQDGQFLRISIRTTRARPGLLIFPADGSFLI